MRRSTVRSLPLKVLVYTLLFIWTLVTILPLYWVFSTAFKSPEESRGYPPTLFPRSFSFQNIFLVFNDPKTHMSMGFRPYLNSLIIALGTALLTAIVSFLAGFGFARYRFKGREVLLLSLLFINLLPEMAKMIPLFRMYSVYKLYDTYLGLILLLAAGAAPFSAWLMRGYIRSIPQDLEDAAVIDGCTRAQATRRITAPLAAPGLAAIAVLAFRAAWNEFSAALILTTSDSIRPYTTAIYKYVKEHKSVDWNLLSAASFVSIIPIVIAFAFFQRYFVAGLTRGAVKD